MEGAVLNPLLIYTLYLKWQQLLTKHKKNLSLNVWFQVGLNKKLVELSHYKIALIAFIFKTKIADLNESQL